MIKSNRDLVAGRNLFVPQLFSSIADGTVSRIGGRQPQEEDHLQTDLRKDADDPMFVGVCAQGRLLWEAAIAIPRSPADVDEGESKARAIHYCVSAILNAAEVETDTVLHGLAAACAMAVVDQAGAGYNPGIMATAFVQTFLDLTRSSLERMHAAMGDSKGEA